MSSAMMLERGTTGGTTGFNAAPAMVSQPATAQTGNWSVVPRCEIEFEKCAGGVKIHCRCEDEVVAATLQNLCKMLAGGLCGVCCTFNGATVCQCNLACGNCRCEYTPDGCCITCVSGDQACGNMLETCCETLACCLKNGCCCYIYFGNTPVCCCCK